MKKTVSFSQDVRPVLEQNCLECHKAGGSGLEASGFKMETYDGLMKGTNFGPMIAFHAFASSLLGKACLFVVLFLSLWHAAHRLRVVFHDFGVRKDRLIANAVYLVATFGTAMTAFYLFLIN